VTPFCPGSAFSRKTAARVKRSTSSVQPLRTCSGELALEQFQLKTQAVLVELLDLVVVLPGRRGILKGFLFLLQLRVVALDLRLEIAQGLQPVDRRRAAGAKHDRLAQLQLDRLDQREALARGHIRVERVRHAAAREGGEATYREEIPRAAHCLAVVAAHEPVIPRDPQDVDRLLGETLGFSPDTKRTPDDRLGDRHLA